MTDYLVLSLVVSLALAAHVWIYLWIRFRIDEGVISKYLNDSDSPQGMDEISLATELNLDRVRKVCRRSAIIERAAGEDGAWQLKNPDH